VGLWAGTPVSPGLGALGGVQNEVSVAVRVVRFVTLVMVPCPCSRMYCPVAVVIAHDAGPRNAAGLEKSVAICTQ